jgi:hypothetical protein
MVEFHPFKLDAKKLTPLLQKELYKDPKVMIRETLQNAIDAINQRATIDPSFNPQKDGEILFEYDEDEKALRISDNGIGMDKKTLLNIFRYYGRSEKGVESVGCFGIGAKSIFAAADSFTIHTRSAKNGETHLVYVTLDGLSFLPNPPPKDKPGTTITVPLEKEITSSDVSRYSRCVKIPVRFKKGETIEDISMEDPPESILKIEGDGFDVYLQEPSYHYYGNLHNISLYINGLPICEVKVEGLGELSVDVKRKDLINLTASRDSPIYDEKYNALMNAVKKVVIDYIKEHFTLEPKELSNGKWVLLYWLWRATGDLREAIGIKESEEKVMGELFSTVYYINGGDRYSHTDTLIAILVRKNPVYYYFARTLRDVYTNAPTGSTVIYKSKLERDALRKWLEAFNIPKLEVKRKNKPDMRLTYLPEGRSSYARILEDGSIRIERNYYDLPVVIFPKEVHPEIITKIAAAFSCIGIKADKEENLVYTGNTLIDLRDDMLPKGIVANKEFPEFHGKLTILELSKFDIEAMSVLPPQLLPIAKFIKSKKIIIPNDLCSACKFVLMGAVPADDEVIISAIQMAIPYDGLRKLIHSGLWVGYSSKGERLEELIELITTLDWSDQYSRALFKLAIHDGYSYGSTNISQVIRAIKDKKEEEN